MVQYCHRIYPTQVPPDTADFVMMDPVPSMEIAVSSLNVKQIQNFESKITIIFIVVVCKSYINNYRFKGCFMYL